MWFVLAAAAAAPVAVAVSISHQAFKDVVRACLTKDPKVRPCAGELLNHRFFRQAKDSTFLQKHFLSGVPPPTHLHRMRVQQGFRRLSLKVCAHNHIVTYFHAHFMSKGDAVVMNSSYLTTDWRF
jgi:serine/threonine protein kinase